MAKARKPLVELSINAVIVLDVGIKKRPQQEPRGVYGCRLCGIAICNHIKCWKEHLEAIPCT